MGNLFDNLADSTKMALDILDGKEPNSQKDYNKNKHVDSKTTIEFFARPINFIPIFYHSYTIFTCENGDKLILSGFPTFEGNMVLNMLIGDLSATLVEYNAINYHKKLYLKDDYLEKQSRIQIQKLEFQDNKEIDTYIAKAHEAVQFIETGNNGHRFDYDFCFYHNNFIQLGIEKKCCGANSNTVQRLAYQYMGLPLSIPEELHLPGIEGSFYVGFCDGFFSTLGEEMCRDDLP